ncbi:hypothetical protein NHH03_03250 [Stieleria sp. TO1_6]|uniref:hypothetical protein n=1 Tax=Stieleria tagensis TaxID=2956795 RepID=UPI00209B9CC6|nr:hypothetical protein [Stieleria tagensis]MCO8120740.1 hypothetical protein [Stieleria tagensis]
MATVNNETLLRSDLDPITIATLNAFRRRRGLLLMMRGLGVGLLVFISLALVLATLDYLLFFSDGIRWCASLGIYLVTAVAVWLAGVAPMRSNDPLEIARHVEAVAPRLREDLVSAVELSDPESDNGSAYFRRILQSRVARRIARVDVGSVLPLRLIQRWLLSGGLVAAFCIALMFIPSAQFARRFARAALPGIAIERASRTKVTILNPSPPSGYVAQRDAVGVIARVWGADDDDVMLHWRSADGTSGETIMTPRVNASDFQPGNAPVDELASASSPTDPPGGRFAANLSVGSVPIQYRITAGDAITLWHELTPLPRPRVLRFEKLYRLPTYAKLADRSADEEHGDLKALQGSIAEVTVTFDQPVESPLVRFGTRGTKVQMEAVDDSATKFLAKLSIKTSGQYQVDATSVRSGLNNPFSPNNTITPVLDTPPVIHWGDQVNPKQLVSSLDVLPLTVTVQDDLPIERITQEFQLNGGPFTSIEKHIETPDRRIELDWNWDLMDRMGDASESQKLSPGDVIQTRMVAVDRRGTRTQSETIELLIAGDGFNADRHQFLHPLSETTAQITKWARGTEQLAKSLKEIGDTGNYDPLPTLNEQWKTLQSESVGLVKAIEQTLRGMGNPASASLTELSGRAVIDIETRVDGLIKRMDWLSQQQEPKWENQRKRFRSESGRLADQASFQSDRLAKLAENRFSLALTAALFADVTTVQQNVDRINEQMPPNRLPRYLTLVSGQLKELDRLIAQYEPLLSPTTQQHLSGESWMRWSQRWTIQMETLLEDDASRDQAFAVLESLRQQIKDKPQQVIDSRLHDEVLRWGRDLRKEMFYLSDLTRKLNDTGKEWAKAKSNADRDKNADDAIISGLDLRWRQLDWEQTLNQLTVRTAGQERLNRARTQVDLDYAADQNLFLRAIKNVTSDGFQPYRDQPPEKVLDQISGAIGMLQARSDIAASRNHLLAIRQGERMDDSSPIRKLYHPIWLRLQMDRIELGLRYLRQSNLDWQTYLDVIDRTRYNDDHQQANSRIDSRRWKTDPFISAGKPLESMARDLGRGLQQLEPEFESARDVLRQYALTLSEQARQAAEAATIAQQQTDQRPDATSEAAEQVKPQQQEAVEKATETIQSLIDQANTADIVDQQQREVARDADAAAELIADALRETNQALKQSDSATSDSQRDEAMEAVEQTLEQLSQRLDQAAEHFEKIENGEDIAESREQLRQAEQQLNDASQLDQRYDSAQKMADSAKQDPRELLKKLEQELKRNEEMQRALSDISAEMVRDAANNLEQAAKNEDTLNRRLESEDGAFAEQKRQKQLMLNEFVQRAQTLRDRTLATAAQAEGWANEPQAEKTVNDIREQISQAMRDAQQVADGNPTLDELQAGIATMQRQLQQAAKQTQQVAQQSSENAAKDLHGDAKKRNSTAANMGQKSNHLRNEELRALDQQRQRWRSAENDAGNRFRSAERQQQQAEAAIKREQQNLKKHPDNEGIQNEIQKQTDRRDQAKALVEQTEQTKKLAVERREQANKRANQINESKSQPFEKPNPAAELAHRATQDAAERMQELATELKQLGEQSEFDSQLSASEESAENLVREQQKVENEVQAAADDLARAARHESRLDKQQLADQLQQASDQTETKAGQAAQQAGEQLNRATKNSERAAQAGDALESAAEQIAQQAAAVGQLLQQSQAESSPSESSQSQASEGQSQASDLAQQPSEQPSPAPSADASQSSGQSASGQSPAGTQNPSSSAPSRAQQMAQTLDELDQSIAAESQAQGAQAQQSPGDESGQPTGQPANQNSQSQPGAASDNASSDAPPQNAMQASPTLAQMMQAQMQQAARQRMQSLQQARAGQEPNQPTSSPDAPSSPGTESGQGQPPAGSGDVDLLRGPIQDGQWGDLRRRGVDDAAQGRGSRIPPGYAREIQAYFKAISKRAAESK